MLQLAVTMVAMAAVAGGFQLDSYRDTYACGVCKAVEQGENCEKFGACWKLNATVMATATCEDLGLCERVLVNEVMSEPAFDLRVTKGLGTKGYPSIRLSVVTENGKEPKGFTTDGFEYSAKFRYKWTGNSVHTSIVTHPSPGSHATFTVGGRNVSIKIPAEGEGVSGVLIGDPCTRFASVLSLVACKFAERYNTKDHTPAMLNALLQGDGLDFWGILGDNFYDQGGHTTRKVYDSLTMEAKSKIYLTVPGNHDYWVLGDKKYGTRLDQFGYGHMQWNVMDTKAAEKLVAGGNNAGVPPFDYSVDPSKGHILFGGSPPAIANSFWYNQVGNVGFVGYSGVYSLEDTMPMMREACQWLNSSYRAHGGTIDAAVLVGHWDFQEMGCEKEMDVPRFYDEMKVLPGCSALDAKGVLKFFMGHTHCNLPHPHGRVGTGFMVAGQGMEGCGNYGFPILDTTEQRLRVWYFDISTNSTGPSYDDVHGCISSKGWRGCTNLAKLWLNQPL